MQVVIIILLKVDSTPHHLTQVLRLHRAVLLNNLYLLRLREGSDGLEVGLSPLLLLFGGSLRHRLHNRSRFLLLVGH